MPFAQSAVLALLLAAPASASPESATFVTLLDGKPAGKEVVTRSAGEKGPILRSRTELSLPGGISLTFDQEASLAPDGFGVVAYRLAAVGAGQNARITASPVETGWTVEATSPDGSVPATRRDLTVTGRSLLVDNNLASHLDLLCRGLALSPGEKLSATVVVPQVMLAFPTAVTRIGQGRGMVSGKPVETRTYRMEMSSVVLELDCRAPSGGLLEARVPLQKATYRLEGYAGESAAPEAPDPRERDTVVEGPQAKLPAVMTLPRSDRPVPVVVLLSGSGPNDRDETIGPNKPFRDLARGLADRGIATLRFDKRAHLGKGATSLRDEYIADALAAIELARRQPGVDGSRVFLLGHSLGTLGALATAAEGVDLRGLVLMAGPSRPVDALLVDQFTYQAKLVNADAATIEAQRKQIDDAFARYRDPKDALAPSFLGGSAQYWRDLLSRDAAALVSASKLPVLVLQGDKDIQVRKDLDFDVLKTRVGEDGGRVTYRSFPGLNHLFMKVEGASTGGEYAIPGRVAVEVVDAVASWALAR